MKFELKTENENYAKSFTYVFSTVSIIGLTIIFSFLTIKLGVISRHFQIDYKCKLLSVEKSKANFKKLSKLTNLKSKQRIWEFCKEVVK